MRRELSDNTSTKRFKPNKRPSGDTDNPLSKVLESIVSGLEQSMGKRTYLCGNPECGALIIFHSKEPRPVICLKCGTEIDWEGEYVTRIKVCPKCHEEYDSYANFCSHHSPAVTLVEKEIEK